MKNLIAKIIVLSLVVFSVTSCALILESPGNKGNNKGNSKKEVKSSKQQSSSRR